MFLPSSPYRSHSFVLRTQRPCCPLDGWLHKRFSIFFTEGINTILGFPIWSGILQCWIIPEMRFIYLILQWNHSITLTSLRSSTMITKLVFSEYLHFNKWLSNCNVVILGKYFTIKYLLWTIFNNSEESKKQTKPWLKSQSHPLLTRTLLKCLYFS